MAESPVFYYETEVEWKKEKGAQIGGPSLPAVPVGAPPEFKGSEGVWSPEHLFVASLNTCYMLTFLAIAENSKVPLMSFSSTAKGKLEKVAGSNYQITEIVVKPRVVNTNLSVRVASCLDSNSFMIKTARHVAIL